MNAINRIICPLDFSSASENALKYALRLADVYQAEVHLLHVIIPMPDAMLEIPQTVPSINRRLVEDARINLRKLGEDMLTEVSASLKNEVKLSTEVEVGPISLTVNEIAKERADLIVMGTQGAEKKPWWMGSVAKDIIDHPSIPVLVIPAMAEYQAWERINFATDLHKADVMHLLELVAFVEPQQPELRCLHITTEEDENTELSLDELMGVFKNQLPNVNITFHQSEEEDTTEALEAFNLMYHIDLQVLVRPRRNFFQELFHQSQSKRTVAYTHVPLLIWPG